MSEEFNNTCLLHLKRFYTIVSLYVFYKTVIIQFSTSVCIRCQLEDVWKMGKYMILCVGKRVFLFSKSRATYCWCKDHAIQQKTLKSCLNFNAFHRRSFLHMHTAEILYVSMSDSVSQKYQKRILFLSAHCFCYLYFIKEFKRSLKTAQKHALPCSTVIKNYVFCRIIEL